MALVTITGALSDFGLQSLTGSQPRIVFSPNGPAFKGSRVFATKDVVVPVMGSGSFSVQLESTENLRPYRTFTVRVEWLNPPVTSGGSPGWVGVDIIENFQVPPQGGAIGDIAGLLYDPTAVWVSPTAPPNPALSTWWLNTTTGDLYEWE